LDVVYRQEVEALTNGVGAFAEIDEDELKIILFNLCREIKAIFNAFARPAFASQDKLKEPQESNW
jgi:hypothetical protein